MDAVLFAFQLVVGAILLMSALLKFLDLRDFTETVRKYAIIPSATAPVLALAVPVVEFIAAALLLSGELARAGAALAAGLFVVFMVAVGINIRRGVNLECGCFGLLWREETGWPTVTRDGILLLASVAVLAGGAGVVLRGALDGRDSALDLVPAVLVGGVVVAAALTAAAAYRANRSVEPPPPTPENLPPPDPALS